MRRAFISLALPCFLVAVLASPLRAQSPQDAIRSVLTGQQAAWNRSDIVAFMQGYDDSPQTTFIGKSVAHGYQKILARYRQAYASHEAMGRLAFTDLDVRMLGPEHAVVTGHFHLTRTAAGGGDASGVFSLIFERKAGAWKIILDHTSS
ncbi:MAG: YybH family protein [Acidobacteriota bacterium]